MLEEQIKVGYNNKFDTNAFNTLFQRKDVADGPGTAQLCAAGSLCLRQLYDWL
jgi:hypothetical protein